MSGTGLALSAFRLNSLAKRNMRATAVLNINGRTQRTSVLQRGSRVASSARPAQPTSPPGLDAVQLRPGRRSDASAIMGFVLSEKINPFGLDPQRFTMAVETLSGAEGVVGIVQTVALAAPDSVELRTLVVHPAYRGRGLGSRLVSTQLEGLAPGTVVWLTTVESRLGFYERLGFTRMRLEEAPSDMRLEVAAGLVVARLLAGQQLVVMRCVVQR